MNLSRRALLGTGSTFLAGALLASCTRSGDGATQGKRDEPASHDSVADSTLSFIKRCARDDGSYASSPDPAYEGNSDTSASDIAAVTYAAVLATTMGWDLPNRAKSIKFVKSHQEKDGRFVNRAGKMDPKDPLAVLYNTTQGCVALRAMGAKPDIDPSGVMAPFFEGDAYKKLPWYTTSFFPLFYATIDKPFPAKQEKRLSDHMIANQKPDGYIQNHVASSFHMAHYYRVLGKPTPRAKEMVERTLKDQKLDGGWDIFSDKDWDVHACFDALFIVRQLGDPADARVKEAIRKGGQWAKSCRNPDGGFGHFPGRHSDMDAVYFNFASMIQAGMVSGAKLNLPDANTLGWGHAMSREG